MSSLRGRKKRRVVRGKEWREGRSASCLPDDNRNTCEVCTEGREQVVSHDTHLDLLHQPNLTQYKKRRLHSDYKHSNGDKVYSIAASRLEWLYLDPTAHSGKEALSLPRHILQVQVVHLVIR